MAESLARDDSVCQCCGKFVADGLVACSTGCDLARRIPRGEEVLPATRQLGVALAWGVVLFNQVLFAALSFQMEAREDFRASNGFATASLVVGMVCTLAHAYFFYLARPKRLQDGVAILAVIGLGIGIARSPMADSGEALVLGFASVNLLFGLWLSRGLWLRKASKKGQKA